MAEVKWIKIVTDVFDDEKTLMIETLPDADSIIVIWFKLLCLAGKQNNSGVFLMGRMPYTDEMFATVFRRPLNTVRLALKTFEDFGMIEIINDIVNDYADHPVFIVFHCDTKSIYRKEEFVPIQDALKTQKELRKEVFYQIVEE
jgi:predicted phage replisome organizer